MEITFDCIETFIGVPSAFVDGALGKFFHAYAEMIWELMGYTAGYTFESY